MTTPTTPPPSDAAPDVAAVAAEARRLLDAYDAATRANAAPCHENCRGGCSMCRRARDARAAIEYAAPTLARHVVALAARVTAAEAATEEAAAQRDVDDDPSEVHITAYEAAAYTHAEARAATDALLAGAAPASAGRLVANAMH